MPDLEFDMNQLKEPIEINLLDNDSQNYKIVIEVNSPDKFSLKVIQLSHDGDHIVLGSTVYREIKDGESLNSVDVEGYIGTNSYNDRLRLTYFTKDEKDETINTDEIEIDRDEVLQLIPP